MSTRVRTYAQWRADRDANAAWMKLVDRALPAYRLRLLRLGLGEDVVKLLGRVAQRRPRTRILSRLPGLAAHDSRR